MAFDTLAGPRLIIIQNYDPRYWTYCPFCGKKLSKDIQPQCYAIWCKKCRTYFKMKEGG